MGISRINLRDLSAGDELLLRVLEFVKDNPNQAYLVGGYIRDKVLGRTGNDIDLVVVGDVEKYCRKLVDVLGGSFFLLGNKGVARIVVKNEELRKIDVCSMQGKIEDNLKQRDFTVNSLAVDAKKLAEETMPIQVIDIFEGLRDIKNKNISAVCPEAFKEDPLRILRAVRLSVELGFNIELKTVSFLKESVNLIKNVSAERLQRELFLIFALPHFYKAIELLGKLDIIKFVLPEVEEMKGVTQNNYHHLDVWGHTLLTLKNLEEILANLKKIFPSEHEKILSHINQPFQGEFNRVVPLKFAVLLHDVGKPKTKSVNSSETVCFYHHSEISFKIANGICKRLKISKEGTKIVGKLIAEHMRPGFLSKEKGSSDKAIRRFLRDAGDETVEILLLSLADRGATLGPLSTKESLNRHEDFVKNIMKIYFSTIEKPILPLLTGHDLIKELNLEPGKLIGRLLEEIEEARAEGKISTKEEALVFAEKYIEDYTKK
ncbi:HD domain-containing protein [Candidatus Oleimmundimicrobium sp.]|uniref:CCA tRNA nucleotidyltransferase n=1 Tax=Candidatus Oleimmundimicrobium sp. TaxID=3060597 RepID=UPI002727EFF3|nr:HD domain-containing protein [Candidatus Oleimmundimicrobium sp.]MDO8886016.1 HD domain-containing protein [Candidatus Oleimmundimicrobium sp.]